MLGNPRSWWAWAHFPEQRLVIEPRKSPHFELFVVVILWLTAGADPGFSPKMWSRGSFLKVDGSTELLLKGAEGSVWRPPPENVWDFRLRKVRFGGSWRWFCYALWIRWIMDRESKKLLRSDRGCEHSLSGYEDLTFKFSKVFQGYLAGIVNLPQVDFFQSRHRATKWLNTKRTLRRSIMYPATCITNTTCLTS